MYYLGLACYDVAKMKGNEFRKSENDINLYEMDYHSAEIGLNNIQFQGQQYDIQFNNTEFDSHLSEFQFYDTDNEMLKSEVDPEKMKLFCQHKKTKVFWMAIF